MVTKSNVHVLFTYACDSMMIGPSQALSDTRTFSIHQLLMIFFLCHFPTEQEMEPWKYGTEMFWGHARDRILQLCTVSISPNSQQILGVTVTEIRTSYQCSEVTELCQLST
jgi:hypothetical protein